METISEKTARLLSPDSPLFRYQEVVVVSVMLSMARTSHAQNLSFAQIGALHLVRLRQRMRVGEIADALAMQLPGASKLVAELVDRGLCTRVDDPDDRRAKMVGVTPAGIDFIDVMARAYTTDLPASLTEATPDVVDVFNRIFAALSDAGLTKAPKS